MSTLVDWQIRKLAGLNQGIRPFNEEQLNPASYNLRIGPNGLTESGRKIDLVEGFEVPPGGFILTDVMEIVRVPPSHEAQVILRSSAARKGWDHALAGFVDPGYRGVLTLEFVNCLQTRPLFIQTGMELVQLKFSFLNAIPEKDYSATGRYFGASEVEACKDKTI